MHLVRIAGAGPAGTAAALSALAEGAAVEIWERSRLPRHKVCGEFLSPETGALFERLGVWSAAAEAGPARIERLILHIGNRSRGSVLAEPAFGLSRYMLDQLLLDAARARGAVVVPGLPRSRPSIVATGRPGQATRDNRLFGFKAHFEGPAGDAVELFFFGGLYVGVSPIEGGRTNVCGLAPEHFLASHGFDYDSVLHASEPLAARLGPLTRIIDWVSCGPVTFERTFSPAAGQYRAGDALGFADPFTGTGILNALLTGSLAGRSAARAAAPLDYVRECRRALARPFELGALFRGALRTGWAGLALPWLPPSLLFRLTRPHAA